MSTTVSFNNYWDTLLKQEGFTLNLGNGVQLNGVGEYWAKNSYSHNVGRFAGKVKKFFTAKETRAVTIIGCWAAETTIYATSLYLVSAPFAFFVLLPMWAYSTYSLFTLLLLNFTTRS